MSSCGRPWQPAADCAADWLHQLTCPSPTEPPSCSPRAAARRFAAKPFHASALRAFIKAVQAKPDVFFVTYSQLQQWMEAPVPTSRMASWLQCNAVDFAAEGAHWKLWLGGRRLHWPRQPGGAAGALPPPRCLLAVRPAERAPCTTYTVKAGDTVYSILAAQVGRPGRAGRSAAVPQAG